MESGKLIMLQTSNFNLNKTDLLVIILQYLALSSTHGRQLEQDEEHGEQGHRRKDEGKEGERPFYEGAFSRADQVGTGLGGAAERRERLGIGKELPEGLSECQARADLRNVDQEGIYLAVYLKFCKQSAEIGEFKSP